MSLLQDNTSALHDPGTAPEMHVRHSMIYADPVWWHELHWWTSPLVDHWTKTVEQELEEDLRTEGERNGQNVAVEQERHGDDFGNGTGIEGVWERNCWLVRVVFEGQSTRPRAHKVCGWWWSTVWSVNNRDGELASDILNIVLLLADLGLDLEPEGLLCKRRENNTVVKLSEFVLLRAQRTGKD